MANRKTAKKRQKRQQEQKQAQELQFVRSTLGGTKK